MKISPDMRKIRYNALISFLSLVLIIILSSCSSLKGPVRSKQHYQINEHLQIHPGEINKDRQKLIKEAESWLGTPYRHGEAVKGEGTDCSGLVFQIFLNALDIKLPRNSLKQAQYCSNLKSDEVIAGDLVFFATGSDSNLINHVGIMLDNENFIHASFSKGVVVSKMTNPYYIKRFIMYGRVPDTLN